MNRSSYDLDARVLRRDPALGDLISLAAARAAVSAEQERLSDDAHWAQELAERLAEHGCAECSDLAKALAESLSRKVVASAAGSPVDEDAVDLGEPVTQRRPAGAELPE